jgi:hypothetical protein
MFNCAVDVLSGMLFKGIYSGLLREVSPNFILGGVVSL